MEIRALLPSDNRSTFRSGEPELDAFFQKYAAQNQFRHHIGTTYVAVEGSRLLGYATIAAGHVEIDTIPQSARRGLPRYPAPVLRLARLAVDESARSLGIGTGLLRFVLRLAHEMASRYGCIGVLVDAKPDAVEFYRRLGFTEQKLSEGQSSERPVPLPMFLSIREIEAAGKAR